MRKLLLMDMCQVMFSHSMTALASIRVQQEGRITKYSGEVTTLFRREYALSIARTALRGRCLCRLLLKGCFGPGSKLCWSLQSREANWRNLSSLEFEDWLAVVLEQGQVGALHSFDR